MNQNFNSILGQITCLLILLLGCDARDPAEVRVAADNSSSEVSKLVGEREILVTWPTAGPIYDSPVLGLELLRVWVDGAEVKEWNADVETGVISSSSMTESDAAHRYRVPALVSSRQSDIITWVWTDRWILRHFPLPADDYKVVELEFRVRRPKQEPSLPQRTILQFKR